MHVVFDSLLLYIKFFLECIGVLVIIYGACISFIELVKLFIKGSSDSNHIRFQFGSSVILGLEFMVGADIIGSLIEPDYYSLGLLAILVVIRTVLSYFLNLELESLTPHQREALK